MKKNLHLTASVEQPEVLGNIIEELAKRRYDIGYRNAIVPKCLQAIDTSSIETYVSGNIEFDYNETERIKIPYVIGFLFSCTKGRNNPYGLTWSFSLS